MAYFVLNGEIDKMLTSSVNVIIQLLILNACTNLLHILYTQYVNLFPSGATLLNRYSYWFTINYLVTPYQVLYTDGL